MDVILQLIDSSEWVVCFDKTAEDERRSQEQAAHIHGNGLQL
jgi:hypothetical protein